MKADTPFVAHRQHRRPKQRPKTAVATVMLGRWSSHIILGAVPSVVELLCVAAANAVVVVAQAQSQLGPEHETRYVEGRGRRRARRRRVRRSLVDVCVYATILSTVRVLSF